MRNNPKDYYQIIWRNLFLFRQYMNGKKLQIFDARKILFRRFADVSGKIGEINDISAQSFKVTAQGGMIEVLKAKLEDGKKASGGELAQQAGIKAGILLGSWPIQAMQYPKATHCVAFFIDFGDQ